MVGEKLRVRLLCRALGLHLLSCRRCKQASWFAVALLALEAMVIMCRRRQVKDLPHPAPASLARSRAHLPSHSHRQLHIQSSKSLSSTPPPYNPMLCPYKKNWDSSPSASFEAPFSWKHVQTFNFREVQNQGLHGPPSSPSHHRSIWFSLTAEISLHETISGRPNRHLSVPSSSASFEVSFARCK